MKNVITAQKKAIEALKGAINSFVKNGIPTRVIPLAIPTGWGKTRIAIQAVLKADYEKYKPPIVVIWPQKHSHISKEIWLRCTDWCNKKNKTNCPVSNCDRGEMPEIKYLHSSKRGPKSGRQSRGAGLFSRKFKGTFYSVNNRFTGVKTQLDKTNGPIVFIIDEWHSKKLAERYKLYKLNGDANNSSAESFWRDKLIGKTSTRQLFVILISATPIGTTSDMDSMNSDEDNNKYKNNIEDALRLFNELTSVGNQRREYNLYKIYPDVIKLEENKLKKINAKSVYKCSTHNHEWGEEYIKLSKKNYTNKSKKPNPPSMVYPLEALAHSGATLKVVNNHFKSLKGYFASGFETQHETLKLKTVKELLEKYSKQKFVIFCHYIAVAQSLNNYLTEQNIPCYYLEGDVRKKDDDFNSFNDDNGQVKVLIVTDEHSQGVSLHKSKAWLIHFELSWNPIRIIQRYGRVWRIDYKTKRLTIPSAFYIPHSFSAEEEMIVRLRRRWAVLRSLPNKDNTFVNLAPISHEVALGIRCTPDFR